MRGKINCEHCGAEFEWPRSRRRTCSIECRDAAYSARPEVKARRAVHAEANKERLHNYYIENRDAIIARNTEWAATHKEDVRGYKRAYSQTDVGKEKDYEKRRRRLARLRNAEGHFTRSQFRELCATHWNRCLCCGEKTKLEADHVVALVNGGSDDISNIQPLCRNCNAQKATDTVDYRPLVTMASFAEEIDNHPAFRNQPLSIAQESRL